MDLFDQIHSKGNTVIMVTHEEDIAEYAPPHRPVARWSGRDGSRQREHPQGKSVHAGSLRRPMMRCFLLFLLFIGACSHRAIQSVMTLDSASKSSKISFLSLGDSYTIGEGVPDLNRWPMQMADRLRRDSTDLADPDIIAKTGWTTNELQTAIAAFGNKNTYDLVSLLIGVNNQYRGRSLKRYRTDFRKLLQTAVNVCRRKS